MSNAVVRVSSILIGAAAIISAGASTIRADELLVATVPFEFVVANQEMPSGGYVVRRASGQTELLSIASTGREHFTFVMTIPSTGDADGQPELVFRRVGQTYYLSRIIFGSREGHDLVLPASIAYQEADLIVRIPLNNRRG
jgi:hypothetical protein